MSLSLLPSRCSASISSPMARASSSPSQAPRTMTFSGRSRVGPQRLAQPALVVGDQAGGRAQDVRGRAVVALQPDDLGAGEILLEAQDVVDLGAAPAVDRLVVVADAADVLRCPGPAPAGAATDTARRWCPGIRRPACSGSRPGTPPARPGWVWKSASGFVQQQVAEVAGVQRASAAPDTAGRDSLALAVGEAVAASAGRQLRRAPAAVLPAASIIEARMPGRPALVVDVLGLEQLLHQADLVVGVEDGETRTSGPPARHGGAGSWRRSSGRCRARACPRPRRR